MGVCLFPFDNCSPSFRYYGYADLLTSAGAASCCRELIILRPRPLPCEMLNSPGPLND